MEHAVVVETPGQPSPGPSGVLVAAGLAVGADEAFDLSGGAVVGVGEPGVFGGGVGDAGDGADFGVGQGAGGEGGADRGKVFQRPGGGEVFAGGA